MAGKHDGIEEILKSGKFDGFVGLKEDNNFEAKKQIPYDLDSSENNVKREAIFELVTDVASIANNSGGYIVFGLDTDHDQSANTDIVTGTKLFEKKNFYSQTLINGLLGSKLIYPALEIEVVWYPSADDPSAGLGVFKILPETSKRKRFVVGTSLLGETNRNFIGIPIRHGHEKIYLTAKQVYLLIKDRPEKWQESHEEIMGAIRSVQDQVQNITLKPDKGQTKASLLGLKMEEIGNE